jgi:hypothetical protein
MALEEAHAAATRGMHAEHAAALAADHAAWGEERVKLEGEIQRLARDIDASLEELARARTAAQTMQLQLNERGADVRRLESELGGVTQAFQSAMRSLEGLANRSAASSLDAVETECPSSD